MKKTLIAIIIFIFSLPALAHTVFYLDRSIGEANCGHTTDSWDWYDPANRRCGTEGDPVYENPDGCQDYDDIGCYGYYIENDVWNGASGSFPVPSGGDTVYLRGDPNNAVQAHQISTITNSNSGTNGNPLSVRNYPGETVYISAAQLYTGTWTEVATNKWCTAVDSVGSDPEVVIFDKELGVPYRGSPNYDGDFAYDCTQSDRPWDGSGESCDCTGSGTGNNCDTCPDDYLTGDKQWCWDADGGAGVDDRLCVYSTSNPSTVYTSPGIEYGLYNYPVYLDSSAGNGIDYVEFRGDAQDHFFLEGGKYNGAYLYGNGGNSDFSSSGVGFYNLTSRFNYRGGFQVRGLKEVQAADWTIQDCKAVYNGQSGISYSDNNNNATIHRNEITDNGWSDFSDTAIQSSAESHYLAAGWTACGSGDCGAYSDIWISDDNQDYPVIEYIQLTIICSAVNDYLGAYYEDRRVDSYTSINSEGEWCDSVNTNNYCGTGNSAHSGKFFIYSTADLDTVCTSAGANAVYGRAVGVTISNNFVARQHDDFGPEGHGIQPSGDGIVVKNNFIYDVGHYGIHLGNTENAKIYYNIILDPSGGYNMIHGIGLNRGLINDIQILNNTISLDGNLHAIDMSEQIWAGAINGLATRIEIKNNIFTNCETGIETDTSSAQSGTIAQYNFFDDNLSGSDTAGSAPITLDSTNFHDGDGDNSGSLILDADNKYFSLLPESVAVDGATFFPEIQKTGWTDNPYCMPDYSARERLSGSKPDLGACELTQHKLYMLNSPGPWYLGNDYTDFCYGVFGNNIQYGTNPVSGLGTLPNGTLRRVALGDCIMNKGQICVWVQDAHDSSHEVNFVIYDDDASGGEPSTLLYESGKFYDASTADPNGKIVCKDFELSEHLSGNVWTGVLFEHGDSEYGNAGRENNGRYDAISSFDPAPDPWDHAGDGDSSLERTIYLNF